MMYIQILKASGIGLIVSIVVGVMLGLFGIGPGLLSMVILFVTTYIATGYIAARNIQTPYLAACIAAFVVIVINQVFTGFYVGVISPIGVAIGVTVLLPALLGAVLADRPWQR